MIRSTPYAPFAHESTGLLSLNEDVLRCIVARLHGRDALNLSLTSRRLHDLAIHRVAAVIVCRDARQLRLLHRYMFFGSRPRARYLERLSLFHPVLRVDPIALKIQREVPDGITDKHDWYLLNLVLDLLMNAPNLRHLKLPLHPILERDPRFVDALRALPSLTSLVNDAAADTSVTLLRSLPCDLRRLVLNYNCRNIPPMFSMEGEPATWKPLLDTVSAFSSLHTLRLEYFLSPGPLFGGRYAPPTLASVRTLMLRECGNPGVLDIIQLCPNIRTLYYSALYYARPSDDPWVNSSVAGARWPALHEFKTTALWEASYVANLLSRVYHLQIADEYTVIGDPSHPGFAHLLEIVRIASPAGMYLTLRVGAHFASFWEHIAEAAPDLRFLELKLSPDTTAAESSGWLGKVADALQSLRGLVSLRILLPRLAGYVRIARRWTQKATIHALEQERSESAKRLPQQLADAIPTLRFVGVCEAGPSYVVHDGPENEDKYSAEEGVGAAGKELEFLGEHDPEDEWEETGFRSRFMSTIAYSRWWRVRAGAGGRRLEEMPLSESNRVRYFLQDAEFADISLIEEHFP